MWERLGLVHFTPSVHNIAIEMPAQFLELFSGLGKLDTEYDIKLDPNVQP